MSRSAMELEKTNPRDFEIKRHKNNYSHKGDRKEIKHKNMSYQKSKKRSLNSQKRSTWCKNKEETVIQIF
jgi:hypothetical protein